MPSSTPGFHGWRMVAVAFLVDFVAVGFFFYSFGVYYPAIDADLAGDSLWVAMGISVSNVVGGIFAPFVGRALDRHSIKRIMMLGSLVVAAGFALLSTVTAIWQYYLVLGTFFAFGLGMMGGMASAKLVANWFEIRRGTALGIATMGVSLSGLVMPSVATWLVSAVGWRGGFLIYAAGIVVLVLPVVSLFAVTRPEDLGQKPDGGAAETDGSGSGSVDVVWSTRQLLRQRNFWMIALPFATTFSALSAVLIHVVPFAADLGIEGYRAGSVLSVAAGAGVIGKVVFGRLGDSGDPRLAVWASFGTQTAGLLVLMHAGGFSQLVAGGLVFGFGMGGVVPLQGALTGKAFGRLSFGKVMGLMRPVQVPLHAVGIPLAAALHDATGSFHVAFWIFVGVYVASGIAVGGIRVGAPPAALRT